MSFWHEYETDHKAEQQGKWKDFRGGLSLKIARADADANPAYAKTYQEIISTIDENDEAQAAEALIELYASLVIDAKGFVGKDGKALNVDRATVKDLFIKLPELYKEVRIFANNYNNYKVKQAADSLGK